MVNTKERRVHFSSWSEVSRPDLEAAIEWCGGLEGIGPGSRVAIKPNLTYPFFERGVTTPPDAIRVMAEVLVDRGARVIICEAGPSLEAFSTRESFANHGVYELRDQLGVEVVDLHDAKTKTYDLGTGPLSHEVPLPAFLEELDLFITMPLVKVHCMTRVSLSLKNQWGLLVARKRFLFHSDIDSILTGINSALPRALVVSDARWVLDDNGPMFGNARPGNFLAVSNDLGAFDFVVTRHMGFDPASISHLRAGMRAGLVPTSMDEVEVNTDPSPFFPFRFRLNRTLQNWAALAGFRSYRLSKLGWDSRFGDLAHKVLYAVKGNPLWEAMEQHGGSHTPAPSSSAGSDRASG